LHAFAHGDVVACCFDLLKKHEGKEGSRGVQGVGLKKSCQEQAEDIET